MRQQLLRHIASGSVVDLTLYCSIHISIINLYSIWPLWFHGIHHGLANLPLLIERPAIEPVPQPQALKNWAVSSACALRGVIAQPPVSRPQLKWSIPGPQPPLLCNGFKTTSPVCCHGKLELQAYPSHVLATALLMLMVPSYGVGWFARQFASTLLIMNCEISRYRDLQILKSQFAGMGCARLDESLDTQLCRPRRQHSTKLLECGQRKHHAVFFRG